eukprot:CAMPEP_0197047776 /NCGR_PEP_ID=MMETSP1384-20130603/23233_1 /TAXON_ID=29189 /ORGANISM="Ammonia sp." /LENGTH=51 /DNA_ID=CAMNT_0042479777 /DNA_START=13 /DNA_END=164 /DNA_ORIENTATION=-
MKVIASLVGLFAMCDVSSASTNGRLLLQTGQVPPQAAVTPAPVYTYVPPAL